MEKDKGNSITYTPCDVAETFKLLPPGICPPSLFLSNRNSTRFSNLPISGGMLPVNPLEWRSLRGKERESETNETQTSQ